MVAEAWAFVCDAYGNGVVLLFHMDFNLAYVIVVVYLTYMVSVAVIFVAAMVVVATITAVAVMIFGA